MTGRAWEIFGSRPGRFGARKGRLAVVLEAIISNGGARIKASAASKGRNSSEFWADVETRDRGQRDRRTAFWRDRL